MSYQVQPWSLEAEMSVVGSMMLSANAADECASALSPSDFHSPACGLCFEAARRIREKSGEADPVAMREMLVSMSALDKVGGEDFVNELDMFVPSVANVGFYIGTVLDHSKRRQAKGSAKRLAVASDSGAQIEELLTEATALVELLGVGGRQVPEVDHRSRIDAVMLGKDGVGHPTGFPSIDHLHFKRRGGLAVAMYSLVAAPSGIGKTTWMLSTTFPALMRGDHCVTGTFADLDADELVYRALRYVCGFGRLSECRTDRDRSQLQDAAQIVHDWNWGIYDAANVEGGGTIEAFRSWLYRRCDKLGTPSKVDLDYAQVLGTIDPRFMGHPTTKNQHVSGVVREMAGKTKAAFLVGSQVTLREGGDYVTKHASDWKDHAAAEFLVARDKFRITKNRHGSDGVDIPTRWDPIGLVVREQAYDLEEAIR